MIWKALAIAYAAFTVGAIRYYAQSWREWLGACLMAGAIVAGLMLLTGISWQAAIGTLAAVSFLVAATFLLWPRGPEEE